MQSALHTYFGFSNFREAQAEIVERILQGEELCVVMPTGAGKSLCYQLPILMRPGFGLVISPLISLMKDQVDALNTRGLPAACINSSIPLAAQSDAMDAAADGRLRFLYVAPERFQATSFRDFIQYVQPNMVVVDEAHCVSQWGHDFRPDYQMIWRQCEQLQQAQVCAFTATATPAVREDIRTQLLRPGMSEVISGFRRPNLKMSVLSCRGVKDKLALLEELLHEAQPTLIYTSTRKEAEKLSVEFDLRIYHAGMNDRARKQAQDYFIQDPCPVLAATNAFGMGIHRPDVRRVIHYNLPGSLEAYYQEAGRAGRDGLPAQCLMFESYQDVRIQEFLLDLNNPPLHLLVGLHQILLQESHKNHGEACLWNPEWFWTRFPSLKNPAQLQSAARVLERLGIVRRTFLRATGRGQLSFKRSLAALLKEHATTQTQRSILIAKTIDFFLANDLHQWHGYPEELGQICGLRTDQVLRVLEYLNNDVLHWHPDESGEGLMLTEAGKQPTLNIDVEALTKKRQLEEERLAQMRKFCNTYTCRQAFIIKYFGEKIGGWKCDVCDNCDASDTQALGRPATDTENKDALSMLAALHSIDGQFGQRRFIGMLMGTEADSKTLLQHQNYNSMATKGEKYLGDLLNALKRLKYMQILEGKYPLLALTLQGEEILFQNKPLKLKMLGKKERPAKKKHF